MKSTALFSKPSSKKHESPRQTGQNGLDPQSAASEQQALPKHAARVHHMDGKISRLHRRSTKRRTVPGTIHFSPQEKLELQRLADSEGLSFSQTGRLLIVDGLVQKLRIQREVTATPALEAALHREMNRLIGSLAEFEGRTLFAVDRLHWLTINKMQWDVLHPNTALTEKEYRGLLKRSIDDTMKNVYRFIPHIAAYVQAVKKWLRGEEQKV
jgi:hypothetical protein